MCARSPFIFVEREDVRDQDPNSGGVRLVDGRELPMRRIRMIPAVVRGSSVDSLPPIDVEYVARVAREMDTSTAGDPFDARPA